MTSAVRLGLCLVLAGSILSLISACGAGPDENSGGDEKRSSAKLMPLAMPVHDRLDPAGGDTTDWKKIEVPVYETVLTVRAWWDNPDAIATIIMRDQFGGKMYTLDHNIGERKNVWPDIKVREGTYLFEIIGKTGLTVYTLEVTLEEGGPSRLPGAVPRPE
ncbi:MAG: hypothetical protein HUU55_01950 [Myxococcales bacterium]|nr:hypothetical protein [Myxococcales bacterium]